MRHRHLLFRVTATELRKRYAGSLAGVAWAVLLPACVLSIYALIYLEVFQIRAPSLSREEYVLYICAGLVPFLATAEVLSTAPAAVAGNKSLLSNTVFPLDLVPVVTVLLSQTSMIAGFALVLIATAVTGHLTMAALLLPFIWALHGALLIALAWILSLITIVIRDIQVAMTVVVMILLVASPIAYTGKMVPARLEPILALNPLAHFISAYQKVVVLGEIPSAGECVIVVLLGAGSLVFASWFFGRAKKALVDFI